MITNSTFSKNSSSVGGGSGGGGAILTEFGPLTVTSSTFYLNTSGNGNAIAFGANLPTINNSIFYNNGAAGGNCNSFVNSVVSLNNISDDATCGFGTSMGANNQTIGDNVNPFLDADGLTYNGGPNQTIGLQANSPAIAGIPSANCPALDQRGFTRPNPLNGLSACDIGAVEQTFGDTVLIAGGAGDSEVLASTELYDPAANSFAAAAQTASMNAGRT